MCDELMGNGLCHKEWSATKKRSDRDDSGKSPGTFLQFFFVAKNGRLFVQSTTPFPYSSHVIESTSPSTPWPLSDPPAPTSSRTPASLVTGAACSMLLPEVRSPPRSRSPRSSRRHHQRRCPRPRPRRRLGRWSASCASTRRGPCSRS